MTDPILEIQLLSATESNKATIGQNRLIPSDCCRTRSNNKNVLTSVHRSPLSDYWATSRILFNSLSNDHSYFFLSWQMYAIKKKISLLDLLNRMAVTNQHTLVAGKQGIKVIKARKANSHRRKQYFTRLYHFPGTKRRFKKNISLLFEINSTAFGKITPFVNLCHHKGITSITFSFRWDTMTWRANQPIPIDFNLLLTISNSLISVFL